MPVLCLLVQNRSLGQCGIAKGGSLINPSDAKLTFALILWCFGYFTEVIELSSGEDDALQIVDSSDSGNEGEEDGSEESSGSHVNDALNQSDALGQVIVNINHPPNEEDIFLAPQLAHAVKPHQVGFISLETAMNSCNLSRTSLVSSVTSLVVVVAVVDIQVIRTN